MFDTNTALTTENAVRHMEDVMYMPGREDYLVEFYGDVLW